MTPTITAVGREAVDRFEPLWRALDAEHGRVDRVVGYLVLHFLDGPGRATCVNTFRPFRFGEVSRESENRRWEDLRRPRSP